MKDYLNESSETWLYEREFCMQNLEDVTRFVQVYHKIHIKLRQGTGRSHDKQIKFGLKCPGVLYRSDIQLYRQFFPRTKLIVGLRHPVSWFESFYNYQIYKNISLPPTSELTTCEDHRKVCTERARFHSALARLGLTSMESEEEVSLLFGLRYSNTTSGHQKQNQRELSQNIPDQSNPVFLYEIRQIHNSITAREFSIDIQQYIQINEALPNISSYTQNKTRAINICDSQHENVRRVLVEHGRDATDWIKQYFAKSPNVIISAPELFFDLLEDWRSDPCED
jgi:hypothetical protein